MQDPSTGQEGHIPGALNSETETEEAIGQCKEKSLIDEQDGGYGWVCVICQLLITASTWGVNGVSRRLQSPSPLQHPSIAGLTW